MSTVIDAIVAWQFNGDGGCDKCQGKTGYYNEKPARPHENCDCWIIPKPYVGAFTKIYKNKVESSGSVEQQLHEGVARLRNTSTTVTGEFSTTVSKTITGEIGVSAEIEEGFSVSGKYTESITVSKSVKVSLEPGQSVEINLIGLLLPVTFSADLYYQITTPIEGTIEIYMGPIDGAITSVSGFEIEISDIEDDQDDDQGSGGDIDDDQED